MVLIAKWAARALVATAAAGLCACVTLDDRCEGVTCGEGEICIDVEPQPECVCDDNHVQDEDTGACVPAEQ